MSDAPNQIYHTSGTPPLIYYKGKAYIGGSVSHMAIGQSSLYNVIITEGKAATYSAIEREENV